MVSSEAGFNELMRVLLDSFSKQERSLFLQEHSGEQGNGFRPRRWRGYGCSFELRIPRTRSGAFQPLILGILSSRESERALLFHELYSRGLSCEDISEVCERIYGHHYSKQQVSHLSGACYEEISQWLSRRLSPRYLAVYIDATFCATRRDGSVSKEAYYTMLGLLPDGSREVLTLVNHPTEGAIAWEMELQALRERGVKQIDLIVSDALSGIENAVCSAFPTALHQLCVVHFKRKVLNCVSAKDKVKVIEELKTLFPVEGRVVSPLEAYENLRTFAQRWGRKYPSLLRLGQERNAAYFTYLRFPEGVRRMIYSTNRVERLNRSYKRTLLMRGAMPSASSVVYLLGSVAREKTEGAYARRLPYFREWEIQ
ncbi:IS256 family transposase [Alloprevotella sp. OH1205_COT-284]|uniref:IS256 family transposase n=1 Tax=Alloprevotella sp. OH1205_COT-284 TaxID=2491043 RepID=UPI002104A2E2|nr:IS256 family transposase [Alloprevotella sp. OH1205_COT-284]